MTTDSSTLLRLDGLLPHFPEQPSGIPQSVLDNPLETIDQITRSPVSTLDKVLSFR